MRYNKPVLSSSFDHLSQSEAWVKFKGTVRRELRLGLMYMYWFVFSKLLVVTALNLFGSKSIFIVLLLENDFARKLIEKICNRLVNLVSCFFFWPRNSNFKCRLKMQRESSSRKHVWLNVLISSYFWAILHIFSLIFSLKLLSKYCVASFHNSCCF